MYINILKGFKMNSKYLFFLIIASIVFGFCGDSTDKEIFRVGDVIRLVDEGKFKNAENLIHNGITSDLYNKVEKWDLQFQMERMKRIKMDFRLKREDVEKRLKEILPDVTTGQINKWTEDGSLENYKIDGEVWFFARCVPNLFRINKDAAKLRDEIDPPSGEFNITETRKAVVKSVVDYYKNSTGEKIRKQLEKGTLNNYGFMKKNYSDYKFNMKYTLSVKENVTPVNHTVSAWLPFPRENYRQSDIKLTGASQEDYIIAPNDFLHRTVYFQKKAQSGEPTKFEIEFEYTTHPFVVFVDPDRVDEYDVSSPLYKEFTSQRLPHIVFTEELRALGREIVGDEKNPYRKMKNILKWIHDNRPWASAREYSTISNISMYCFTSGHGDCGIQTLLLMTLARISGVPVKWQSGWVTPPDGKNLHDWLEMYIPPYGWLPVDASGGLQEWSKEDITKILNEIYGKEYNKILQNANLAIDELQERILWYNLGSVNPYRMVVNDDFSQELFPAKRWHRSEPVDFQRGEAEYLGENLYFDKWRYSLKILDIKIN
ncbi:transglutaminase family protein [candidate division KSB1 bacterium]